MNKSNQTSTAIIIAIILYVVLTCSIFIEPFETRLIFILIIVILNIISLIRFVLLYKKSEY